MSEQSKALPEYLAVTADPGTDVYDVAGLYFKTGRPGEVALAEVEATLRPERYEKFSWRVEKIEEADGVVGSLWASMSYAGFSEIRDDLLASLPQEEAATLQEISLTRPGNAYRTGIEEWRPAPRLEAGFDPGDSWYWPLADRLPIEDYNQGAPLIRIAHVDTGVTAHPNIVGGFLCPDGRSFFPSEDNHGIVWWNVIPVGSFIDHGTATGGLIVGQPAAPLTLHGMVLRELVQTLPCRVSNSVILTIAGVARVAKAIDWAVDQGCKVITISLGSEGLKSDALEAAVRKACDNGVIVCCASGQYVPFMLWPASFSLKELCVCCGPSTRDREPWDGSLWFTWAKGYVTIAAPGVTMPKAAWEKAAPEEKHCGVSGPVDLCKIIESEGSSYSTAYTASIAALWYAKRWIELQNIKKSEIVPLFRSLLEKTCDHWDEPAYCGPGILNPNRLLGYFLSRRYNDWAKSPLIAMDDSGNCVELHQDPGRHHHYQVGKVDFKRRTIAWGAAEKHPGATTSIAMDNAGHCVAVCEDYENVAYSVGIVDFQRKTVNWGPLKVYGKGSHPAIALAEGGFCVEAHREGEEARYCRAGKVDFTNRTIEFGPASSLPKGGLGGSIALDNKGGCVVVWDDLNRLLYQVGRVDFEKKTVQLGSAEKYGTGELNAISLNDAGTCVAVHRAGKRDSLFYQNGKVDFNQKKIVFGPTTVYRIGTLSGASVALGADGNWVEVHAENDHSYYTAVKVPV